MAGCVEALFRTSLAHAPDQRRVDLEGFVDLVDVAKLVSLMALSGFARADGPSLLRDRNSEASVK